MSSLHTLAFEIGTEEIPAFDLHRATLQLEKLVPEALDAVRIPHGDVAVYTTPRRLIAIVADVADETEALEEVFRGPSAKIAFDADGNPTKAATGFARGKGVDVDALERREENGVEYVFATKSIAARDVAELLPGVLEGVITGISWPKSCRWGTTSEYFSRPVRWLVALLDERVIPVRFAGLTAGNLTRGHRFLAPGPHEVATAADLLGVVEAAHVVSSEQAREAVIREGVAQAEQRTGARAELPEKTLLEVVNLCEQPTVLVGTFDEEFLRVPEEIIVDAMLMHQRYFPLYDADGKLTNNFIVVSNGDPAHADTITGGNERVVRARLSDAKFFYEEDLKRPLETYVDRLDEVVFQETLGTMKEKADRIVALAKHLAADAQLSEADAADAERAAYLAKADLVTNAVVEFTSVQGVMGSYYAAACGESDQVARAIADHYRPRFSGDEPPASDVGRIVAMADKLDTVCGLFAVGQGPTGSSDPFALRRSAIGIVAMLEAGLPVSLAAAIDAALGTYQDAGIDFDRDAIRAEVADFFVTRTKVMLRDGGCSHDTMDAVLATGVEEPAQIIARTYVLEAERLGAPEAFDDLATAYARANNLRDADLGVEVDEALLSDAERALLAATDEAAACVKEALAVDHFGAALAALAALRAPIDAFFEDVLIMDDDLALRENRLRLLNRFVAVFAHVADFGKMAKGAK
ncbi:glycine--tRNA ligase subunit beta [Eggerthella lenta]|uniref:glycine--tRNA ligase subunit beta n=1 Tax=Eggerthella lenta TaxID=84112 RepID=UPI000DF75B58|nr:glycine--tRNA ligase subunit beta [Eggerthella lenta]RDC03228.1 glycine--tRNA ligase subunit beta [Eggerthella lenta]